MLIYFNWINEVPAFEVKTATVEWVVPGSAAAQAGLQPGDVIRRFADAVNPDWDKINQDLMLNPNQTLPVQVDRDGKSIQLSLRIPAKLDEDDLAGILPELVPGPIGVAQVQSGTPADQAGLRAGDGILSVDGLPFHTVTSLLAYMQAGQGKPISLQVLRNGAVLSMVAHPAKLDTGWKLGFVIVPSPTRSSPLPINKAVAKSSQFCTENSLLLVELLERIFEHRISASNALAGPVGIARAAGDAAESKGWDYKFKLAGVISLNLGIINLMPFPILDGGMILFLLIESVIRREINIVWKERIYQGAFMVLMALFVFLIYNDVSKLPIFAHLKL
jgi:regulator of sigma E protease